jgi:hypothetical protein
MLNEYQLDVEKDLGGERKSLRKYSWLVGRVKSASDAKKYAVCTPHSEKGELGRFGIAYLYGCKLVQRQIPLGPPQPPLPKGEAVAPKCHLKLCSILMLTKILPRPKHHPFCKAFSQPAHLVHGDEA